MKTPDLIAALSSDRMAYPRTSRSLTVALGASAVVSIAIYVAAVHPRDDLLAMLPTARVAFKLLWSAALACAAGGVLLRLASPGRRGGAWLVGLALVAAAMAVAVGVELSVVPATAWSEQLRGHNASWCLRIIPVLALAPLAAALFVLKRAAPTRPAWAGAAAGLLAGALGAVLYATHCPDDSPLFVASWYGLAILGMTLLGSGLGARWLRW